MTDKTKSNKKIPIKQKVIGDNNIQIHGGESNIINITEHHHHKPVKQIHQAPLPDDTRISNAQQSNIQSQVKEWVELSAILKKTPITYPSAWSSLNKYLKVPRYSEIAAVDYDKAINYLNLKKGELRRMKSAAKKVPTWRTDRIKAIQARCNERGLQAWRKEYMMSNFQASSMTQLNDKQIEQLYSATMGK